MTRTRCFIELKPGDKSSEVKFNRKTGVKYATKQPKANYITLVREMSLKEAKKQEAAGKEFRLELKNLKIAKHLSDDSLAFTATLYVDGRRCAHIKNDGNGGSHHYSHTSKAADPVLSQVTELANKNHEHGSGFEIVIDDLIQAHDEVKWLKKIGPAFLVLEESETEWYTFKRKYWKALTDEELKKYVEKNYEGFTIKYHWQAIAEAEAKKVFVLNNETAPPPFDFSSGWCDCENPDPDAVKYYETPSGSHGWDCTDCGKIRQTG